ncbi:hypothetical protein [Dehalobacter sp. UNSWDHB]|uniref:hypothetical protein n=1 Tax=Dehalobacter sp. UNSWDHB TaxID=1339256 RepID=UPI00068F4427|nr:hypothetical protein [Dehalobacter sp. UNSWDHB]
MSAELRSVTIKFHSEMFDQISFLAQKRDETLSDTIRYLVDRGLEEKIHLENTKLLAEVVREQVESVIKSYTIYPSLDVIGKFSWAPDYPSLDDTENPSWATGKLFNNRVNICRKDKRTNKKVYSHIA